MHIHNSIVTIIRMRSFSQSFIGSSVGTSSAPVTHKIQHAQQDVLGSDVPSFDATVRDAEDAAYGDIA